MRPRPPAVPWRRLVRAGRVAAIAAAVLLLGTIALGVGRKLSWYLAVDQFGYLTFAHDLLRGQVFHDWPLLGALRPSLPPTVDVLFQTYVLYREQLFCRYAPGFPLLLAGWIGALGPDAAPYLNLTVFVLLLAAALVFYARVSGSIWRAIAAVALMAYFPTYIDWWARTLVRDLPTHLCGFLALLVLLPRRGRILGPRRTALAGVPLGLAILIRPDAILYLPSAVLLALTRWEQDRAGWRIAVPSLATGALALLLGIVPLLAYNRAATGSPYRLTQGMEVATLVPWLAPIPPELLLGVDMPKSDAHPVQSFPDSEARTGYPSAAWAKEEFAAVPWKGGTFAAVQGGGLRVENVPIVLPQMVYLLRTYYGGMFLGLALLGAVMAFFQRRALFASGVIYTLISLVFFSLWSKPDPRYQVGAFLFLPMLMVEGGVGTLDAIRRFARRNADLARLGAAALALWVIAGTWIWWRSIDPSETPNVLEGIMRVVPPVLGLAALAGALWPRERVARAAGVVLAVVLVGFSWSRAAATLAAPRARFQRPEVLRARQTFEKVVVPGAVVITVEDIGRPAENIDYYSGGARAIYLTDLERWRLGLPEAAELLARGGFTPYLLIPASQPNRDRMMDELGARFSVELVADVPPQRAMEYFVASRQHQGVHLYLYRLARRDS